jgi:SAM-dependent methyltransferase
MFLPGSHYTEERHSCGQNLWSPKANRPINPAISAKISSFRGLPDYILGFAGDSHLPPEKMPRARSAAPQFLKTNHRVLKSSAHFNFYVYGQFVMAQILDSQFKSPGISEVADAAGRFPGAALTERQLREREYYEQYSKLNEPTDISFDPILGPERRPWNPYWFLCESVAREFRSPGQRLLDFGCGPGIYSVLFGKVGYQVSGFDISPSNVEIAIEFAAKYRMDQTVRFDVGAAERLDYPDEHFDVVVGVDILHHVDIAHSVKECLRVLKHGGAAFFKEPVTVPVFDPLRESALGRWLVPKHSSLERHITEDERKLTDEDLRTVKNLCPDMSVKRFRLFSRLDAFNKKLATNGGPSPIEKIDERVFRLFPFMKTFGGDVVICLRKS